MGPDAFTRGAELQPWRALILAKLSRLVLAAALVATGWSIVVARATTGEIAALPPLHRIAETERSFEVTQAGILEGLRSATGHIDASIMSVEMRRPRDAEVILDLRVMSPGTRSSDTARVLEALATVGLAEARLRSVTPVAGGLQLDVTSLMSVTTAPLPVLAPDVRPVGVVLSEVVEQSGAVLRRLEAAGAPSEAARMEVSGTSASVIALLRALEDVHSAPMRIDAVRVRANGDDDWEASLAFRLREHSHSRAIG